MALSHIPQPLLGELRALPGFREDAFIAAHQLPPPTSVRLHPVKHAGLLGNERQVPWCAATGRYLPQRPVFTLDPAYHAGAYYVQEASSMFLSHVLSHILPGMGDVRVLDLCAAPGGKSTLMASLLSENSLLVSNEVIRPRAAVLQENMTRWGYMNTIVTSNDPRDFSRLPGFFDVILIDAPCSGSGLFRKDPGAVSEWSTDAVVHCAARQQRIIEDAWPALMEGGFLIYATCSYSPGEDENIIDWVAGKYQAEAVRVPIEAKWGIVETETGNGVAGYRFFPDRLDGEGLFVSVLRKKEGEAAGQQQRTRSAHDKKIWAMAQHLVTGGPYVCLAGREGNYFALREAHEALLHQLSKAVYVRQAGIQVGIAGSKEWVPAHEVALSIDANHNLPFVDLTREQALRFLKREDPGVTNIPRGWLLVKYNGLGLGWVKSLGNRVNNYLPKAWRIRMNIDE